LQTKFRLTENDFIKKAKKIHDNKFDYSKVKYQNNLSKIIIICPEHGEFKQAMGKHLAGDGCSKCSGKYMDTTYLIELSIKKRGKQFDYSKIKYTGAFNKVIIGCKSHGDFEIYPRYFLRGQGCQKCNMCPSCGVFKTYGELCPYCIPSDNNKLYKKAYEKSKEMKVVKYLREKLPDYDFIHNKSVGSECTKDDKKNSNGHLFPDIRFDCGFYHLIVEVDEHKHRGADYKCDKQRMYNIIAKLGLRCIFIRYNPDSKESNKDILLEKVKTYLELDIEEEGIEEEAIEEEAIEEEGIWDDFGYKSEYLFY
jgi:very-short-patch-repair endonuclease